jgi:ABC-type multidrug transport system permease subunit
MHLELACQFSTRSNRTCRGLQTTLIVVPLTFISSADVPNGSLPGWMQPVANHSPITLLSNAVRSLMLGRTDAAGIGHTTGYWVALNLVWCVGITVVFGAIAVSRVGRPR